MKEAKKRSRRRAAAPRPASESTQRIELDARLRTNGDWKRRVDCRTAALSHQLDEARASAEGTRDNIARAAAKLALVHHCIAGARPDLAYATELMGEALGLVGRAHEGAEAGLSDLETITRDEEKWRGIFACIPSVAPQIGEAGAAKSH